MAEFAQILIRAKDDTKTAFDSAARNMRGLETGAAKLSGLLSTIGVGAGLSVVGLAAFAKSGIDAADGLNDMSQRLGVSVKDLASFKLAAEQSGTSLDGIGTGIARLTRSIGEAEAGNKKLAGALQGLGITARDPKEAFFQLADAVQRIGDPSERAALLSQVLGKSYQELIPLLTQGGDALRESARQSETFADAMARLAPQADQFNDQLALLKINAAGLAGTVLSKLVPSFNEWIATGQEVVRTGSLLDKLRFFALGNASDEIVGRVRKMAAESAAAAKTARAAIGKIDTSATTAPPKKTRVASDPKAAFVARLRDEAATLGFNSEALKQYEAIKLKLTGTNARLADSYIKQIAAFKDQQAAAKANNDAFDEYIKKQDDAGAKLETSIKSLREWIAEQEFEASLFGKTNAEREAAIQLRALEADGIDTQTESFKKLREQLVAISETRALDSLISDTTIEKTRSLYEKVSILDRALLDGKISTEQWNEAFEKFNGGKKIEELDSFAKKFADNAQDTFADFFKNFDQGTDGMLKKFGETVKGLIAEAVAADLTKRLFGDTSKGSSGGGLFGGALSFIGSMFGGARAEGGPVTGGVPYLVGERGPEMFVPQGNGSIVPNKAMKGGDYTIIVNVNGSNNAPDVRRAAGQGAREALGLFDGARRYG